jgi:hypothetical protein
MGNFSQGFTFLIKNKIDFDFLENQKSLYFTF